MSCEPQRTVGGGYRGGSAAEFDVYEVVHNLGLDGRMGRLVGPAARLWRLQQRRRRVEGRRRRGGGSVVGRAASQWRAVAWSLG